MNSVSRVFRNAKSALPLPVRSMSGRMMDLAVDNERIAILTLNSPPVNAINLELLQEMNDVLDEISKLQVKGAVITSAIPNIFSAGFELRELYKPDWQRAELFWATTQKVFMKVIGSAFPTVAVINGHSPGGACVLSLACEYRVMLNGNDNKIGLNETALGIAITHWINALMHSVMSMKDTERALTAGTLFTPQEALRVGLIDELASDKEDAIEKSKKFIKTFENIEPESRAVSKQRIRSVPLKILSENYEEDAKMFLDYIKKPTVQQHMELYYKKLKQKKKN